MPLFVEEYGLFEERYDDVSDYASFALFTCASTASVTSTDDIYFGSSTLSKDVKITSVKDEEDEEEYFSMLDDDSSTEGEEEEELDEFGNTINARFADYSKVDYDNSDDDDDVEDDDDDESGLYAGDENNDAECQGWDEWSLRKSLGRRNVENRFKNRGKTSKRYELNSYSPCSKFQDWGSKTMMRQTLEQGQKDRADELAMTVGEYEPVSEGEQNSTTNGKTIIGSLPCKVCHFQLPLDQFSIGQRAQARNSTSKSGGTATCKSCVYKEIVRKRQAKQELLRQQKLERLRKFYADACQKALDDIRARHPCVEFLEPNLSQTEKFSTNLLASLSQVPLKQNVSENSKAYSIVYHGTHRDCHAPIIKEGFKAGGSDNVPIRNGTAYGRGIYTALDVNLPRVYARLTNKIFVCIANNLTGFSDHHNVRVYRSSDYVIPVGFVPI